MSEPDSPPRLHGQVDPAHPTRLGVHDVRNVIILVAGTTNPGNMNDPRAQSYSLPGEDKGNPAYWGEYDEEDAAKKKYEYANEAEWYWKDNPKLRQALSALTTAYSNLHLFHVHGWSGDNAADNRHIAGSYLANRLCGGGGEKAYYAGWKTLPVAFHLIGHSHGGNLINEFTKRAAELGGGWPKLWKIRSVVYLSTPFFTRLHQVKTDVFDPECKIINVCCDYDLTQRVIADFSLLPLFSVLEQAGTDRVLEAARDLHLDLTLLEQLARRAWDNKRTGVDAKWTGIEIVLYLDVFPLYDELMRLLLGVANILDQAKAVIETLKQAIWFPVAHELKGKVSNKRPVLSAGLGQRAIGELDRLRSGLIRAHDRLEARKQAHRQTRENDVRTSEVIDDLNVVGDVIEPVADFIALDPAALTGPLVDLAGDILIEQIEFFDNTRRSPSEQLKGTPFASRIVDVDVSRNDQFSENPVYAHRHPRFVQQLEAAEGHYEQSHRRRDLIDLILVLAAQNEMLRKVPAFYAEFPTASVWLSRGAAIAAAIEDLFQGDNERFFRAVNRCVIELGHWAEVLKARDVGGLEVPNSGDPARGSLNWLMRVSHSVSRRDLYPQVEAALTGQFTTRLRRRPR